MALTMPPPITITPASPLSPIAALFFPTSFPISPPAPPSRPAPFIWKCHSCGSKFPLGATNRCLNCSHTFCAGPVKRSPLALKKRKTNKGHVACGSTFDYTGWRRYGKWRREVNGIEEDPYAITLHENCEMDCDFPSQCRWQPRIGKAEQARIDALLIETLGGEEKERDKRFIKEDLDVDGNSAHQGRKDTNSFPVLDLVPSPVEFNSSSSDPRPCQVEKQYFIGSMERDSNNLVRVGVVEVDPNVDGVMMDVDLDDVPEEKDEDSSPTSPSLALRRWGWDWGSRPASIAEEMEDEDMENGA